MNNTSNHETWFNYDEKHYANRVKKDKEWIKKTLEKAEDDYDFFEDEHFLFYLATIMQRVINWNAIDREWFDVLLASSWHFNHTEDGDFIILDSNGIHIISHDEYYGKNGHNRPSYILKRKQYTEYVIEACKDETTDNLTHDQLIDVVTDKLANELSYKNDFDKYQGVNRDEDTYNGYYEIFYPLVKHHLDGFSIETSINML